MGIKSLQASSFTLILCAAAAIGWLASLTCVSAAEQVGISTKEVQLVDPAEQGTGMLGPRGRSPLLTSKRAAAGKADANRRYDDAVRTGMLRSASSPQPQATVAGRSFSGQFDGSQTPANATGAVGSTRYVQMVDSRFGIYNKTSDTALAQGTLQSLTGVVSSVGVYQPQVIWDPTTNRFYYMTLGAYSFVDNRLLWGFSKTASPSSAADWCRYQIKYEDEAPDFARLGDSQYFLIVGVNMFEEDYLRSDILAIPKPPAGSGCPTAASFKATTRVGVTDTAGNLVTTPVPANTIDTIGTGYVVALSASLPSTKLWLFDVTRSSAGKPVISAVGRPLTVASYDYPPDARQVGAGQLIATLDARLTQAVMSRNPSRGNAPSFWTQHTIAAGALSAVRWYEIKPTAPAAVLRSATITIPQAFLYNAGISSDRQVDGTTSKFGGSFVMVYNASSAVNRSNPRIVAGSSLNGGAFQTTLVKDAVGPYADESCPSSGDVCSWGYQTGASPDPRPAASATGIVWLTNQYAGSTSTSTTQSNWRTWIFNAKP